MEAKAFDSSPHMQYLLTTGLDRDGYIRFLQQSQHHMRAAVKAFAVAGTALLDAGNRLAPVASYCLRHAGEEHNEDELCKADLAHLKAKTTARSTPATKAMCDTLRALSVTKPYRIIADSLVVEAIASQHGAAFFNAIVKNLGCRDLKATHYLQLHNRLEAGHAHAAVGIMQTVNWTKAELHEIKVAERVSRQRFCLFLAQFVPRGAIK